MERHIRTYIVEELQRAKTIWNESCSKQFINVLYNLRKLIINFTKRMLGMIAER